MIKQVSIVLANYCPHCVPFSLENANRMAEDFNVPLRILFVEIPQQEEMADRLVEEHGDWSEDYLIPQVFIEHTDGRVDHVLTGFSEAVSVTKTSWQKLFSSNHYRRLIGGQLTPKHNPLQKFIEKYLMFEGRCRRHCSETTSYRELFSNPDNVVGAYVCRDGYVSRVIYYSVNPDFEWFKGFLTSQVGEDIVNPRDIRPATRYGWELGDEALAELSDINHKGTVKEVYWTIYPKTEDEKSRGVFLCDDAKEKRGCKKLFVQDIKNKNKLCQICNH